jgi:Flp pilus assembly protein TadG
MMRKRSRGQAMVEFALVFPVFVATMLFIMDGARLMAGYLTLVNGAQTGLRQTMIRPCFTSDAGALAPITAAVNKTVFRFGNPAPTVTCTTSAGPLRAGVATTIVTVNVTMDHAFDPVAHYLLGKTFATTITLSHTESNLVESPASG